VPRSAPDASGRVAVPGSAGGDDAAGGGSEAVAKGTRDDQGGARKTSWRNAAVQVWVAATPSAELLDERARGEGLASASAGKSHRQSGLAAVFMFARLAASSLRIAAKGSGTRAGGSPRRMNT
jgi:hypothetical protein